MAGMELCFEGDADSYFAAAPTASAIIAPKFGIGLRKQYWEGGLKNDVCKICQLCVGLILPL